MTVLSSAAAAEEEQKQEQQEKQQHCQHQQQLHNNEQLQAAAPVTLVRLLSMLPNRPFGLLSSYSPYTCSVISRSAVKTNPDVQAHTGEKIC